MLKIRSLFAIILFTYSIKFSGANHRQNQINLNFLNFEQIKSDLFTINRTVRHQYELSSQNDEQCLIELNAIGNGVKNLELWAIKRKIICFFSKTKTGNLFAKSTIDLILGSY